MSQVNSLLPGANTVDTSNVSATAELDADFFLQLIIEELLNQDPTNPTETSDLISQVSAIGEISSSDKMIETLDSVLVGQNVSTATSLIGSEVEGITDDGAPVSGQVREVTINDGEPVLEVAVATSAEASDRSGNVEEGAYVYEVAWETDDATFSVQVPVRTEDLGDDFDGGIRIENLPVTSVPKTIYRTDSSGSGDLQFVGTLPNGETTSFTDTLADSDLGSQTLTGSRQVVRFAESVEVRLDNIGQVRTD